MISPSGAKLLTSIKENLFYDRSTMKIVDKRKKLELLVSCAGMAICSLGLILNVNGVFFKPIADTLEIGRGAVSITSTLTTLATGFASVWAIQIVKKKSLRKVLIISLAITILSTIGIAFSRNVFTLYLFSLIRGISSCFFNTPIVTAILGNWFHSSRGTYSGMVMAFSGIAGAVMSPVLSRIIEQSNYTIALLVCSLIMLVVSLPAIIFLHFSPEEEGYLPYKDKETEKQKNVSYEIEYKRNSSLFITLMIIAFLCQTICSLAQHLSGYGESLGFSISQGSWMISMSMIGNIGGKFLTGYLSDRVGEIKAGIILAAGFCFGLLLLGIGSSYYVLLAGSLLLGMSYSSAVMLSNVSFAIYGNRQYGDAYAFLTVVIKCGTDRFHL